MISKWFIGTKAKSKGYFKGFSNYYYKRDRTLASPSFTKQSALAKSYDTKQDALDAIGLYELRSVEHLNKFTVELIKYKEYTKSWGKLSFNEKIKFLVANRLSVTYNDPTRKYGNTTNLNFAYGNWPVSTIYTPEQRTGIENHNWNKGIKTATDSISKANNEIAYIKGNLIARQDIIEYKFKETEKRKISWENRSENDTSKYYCNACGGAIPSVPQLVIGAKWSREGCRICAICMGKLAQEAKIQAEKVSPEILEQYEADRFLIAMD